MEVSGPFHILLALIFCFGFFNDFSLNVNELSVTSFSCEKLKNLIRLDDSLIFGSLTNHTHNDKRTK